ncbi:MAG: hypothetical protein IKS31_04880 [Clostridia bacterium]|nr:hypothetical protein [Clostridia bacterium]
MSWTETRSLCPGLLCDLYILRQAYDDEQHGISRKKRERTRESRAGLK